jgi:hypothetical protein
VVVPQPSARDRRLATMFASRVAAILLFVAA